MRAGIYSRVSTSKQEAENQLYQLRTFAATMGWLIVGEYVDHTTGKHSDRAQFQRMFVDASQRKFDVLLFWSLDRLSREGVLETLQHLNRLTSYGIQWRSLTEQYLDSTGLFRDAVIGVLGRPRASLVVKQIMDMRAHGLSWGAISRATGFARATCQKALALAS